MQIDTKLATIVILRNMVILHSWYKDHIKMCKACFNKLQLAHTFCYVTKTEYASFVILAIQGNS